MIVCLLAFFATVGMVMATTTIGTDITTAGNVYATSTLLVDGASSFTNTVSFANTVTLSSANLKITTGYGLDTVAASGILNIGTSSAITINIGSTGATVAIKGNMTFPTGYGIDAASGVLNIGTTTATQINIGSATSPVVIANSSTTLANFGSGTTISGLLWGTCAVDPQQITAATSSLVSTSCSATGMTSSYKVLLPRRLIPSPKIIGWSLKAQQLLLRRRVILKLLFSTLLPPRTLTGHQELGRGWP